MLTPAKSLVSLSYQADEVGERMQWGGGGTLEAEIPDPVEPDSDGGMVVKNLPGRAKWSAVATTKEGGDCFAVIQEVFLTNCANSLREWREKSPCKKCACLDFSQRAVHSSK